MIKKFANDIYQFDLPMDYSPIGNVNCYLIKGDERSLLVDTGCTRENCRRKLRGYLEELGVEKGSLDIFLTHGHLDHIGSAELLSNPETVVYISEKEYLMTKNLTNLHYWQDIEQYFMENGWPADAEHAYFVAAYQQSQGFRLDCKLKYISDGDIIAAAGRKFQVVLTPGHTKEHMSLWDVENNMIFVGDLIVEGFYPALYYRERALDMLNMYQQSLEKIKNTKASILFSGHKQPIYDTQKCCDDALRHYGKIRDKVWSALNAESGDAFSLAQRMYKEKWELFPVRKKWFYTAGVLSCLESFWLNERAEKSCHNGVTSFFADK